MRTTDLLSLTVASLAVLGVALLQISPAPGLAQTSGSVALSGQVTSVEEGAMEGVLVSAKKVGSTSTITVLSDHGGQYRFPSVRLEPGRYALNIRAVGYELDRRAWAEVSAQEGVTVDLKLRKTQDLASQLTNAEWIAS